MVCSGEFPQQRHSWLKLDPFAITLHIRLQEKYKVTFTWLSNLAENSSILKNPNWSSTNMTVYILKHFCKPWEETSLDISRGGNQLLEWEFCLAVLSGYSCFFLCTFFASFWNRKIESDTSVNWKKRHLCRNWYYNSHLESFYMCSTLQGQPKWQLCFKPSYILDFIYYLPTNAFKAVFWSKTVPQRDTMHLDDLHRYSCFYGIVPAHPLVS